MSEVKYIKCDACGSKIECYCLNIKMSGFCYVEEYSNPQGVNDVYRKLEDQNLDICKECTRHFKSFMKAIEHD